MLYNKIQAEKKYYPSTCFLFQFNVAYSSVGNAEQALSDPQHGFLDSINKIFDYQDPLNRQPNKLYSYMCIQWYLLHVNGTCAKIFREQTSISAVFRPAEHMTR